MSGRRPRRYGVLLLILIGTYLLSAFFESRWIDVAQVGLFTVAALLALRNSPVRRRTGRRVIAAGLPISAAVVVVAAIAAKTSAHTQTAELTGGFASLWVGLLLLMTAVLIVRQIMSMPEVTVQSIYGALSAYLLIGLMYAAFYGAMYYFNHEQFFVAGQSLTPTTRTATFQYFSFTTLTTLGYGDYTARFTGGRAVAMLEAISGQIFLAVLVARLVATFRPRGDALPTDEPDQPSAEAADG